MIENYVEEVASQKKTIAAHNIAVIGAVYDDGVSLVFPGSTKASTKHYMVNAGLNFAKGQKVYIQKVSGTYIVVCPLAAVGSAASGGGTTPPVASGVQTVLPGEHIKVDNTDPRRPVVSAVIPSTGAAGEVYSYEETQIGTWLGKPMYRKVVDLGKLPTNADPVKGLVRVPHGIENLGLVLCIYGVGQDAGFAYPLPHANPTAVASAISLYVDYANNALAIRTGVDRTSLAGHAVIEYLKKEAAT